MSDFVVVDTLPLCDLCSNGTRAQYDARLPGAGGRWGNVCAWHFDLYGPGKLGTGNGQRLVPSTGPTQYPWTGFEP